MNTRTLVIGGVITVAAAAGLWMFKQHLDHSAIVRLVQDSGARLVETLAVEARPAAIGPETVQKFDAHVAAAEKNRAALKKLDSAGRQALVDAADNYLVTAQEILRRQAVGHRSRLQLAESLQALRAHFRADRGAASWVREAVRLRAPMEKSYADYRGAAETFDQLLESLPASQMKAAALVSGMPIASENLIADARKASKDQLARATAEVEKIRQLTLR